MKRMLDLEDFPIGSRVMTPSGRIGIVVKHHATSKIDLFQRISVQFGKNPRDGVVLQPQFLVMLQECAIKNPETPLTHTKISQGEPKE